MMCDDDDDLINIDQAAELVAKTMKISKKKAKRMILHDSALGKLPAVYVDEDGEEVGPVPPEHFEKIQ